jgi:AmmeMemoRadiSam system protein A
MTVDLLGSLPYLTRAERCDLLWLARETIRAAIEAHAPPLCETLTAALSAPAAAFVSLHESDRLRARLRGCIGTLVAETPLHQTVARMAVSAAFDDPRFPALQADELPSIDIEISRLGPLVAARAEQVRPGEHGVCISCRDRRAVFLPQVASSYGWDRDTLLNELCRKALLSPEAWKGADCGITVFAAEVFAERDT